MTATQTSLKGAPIIDFTGKPFNQDFVNLVRGKDKPQAIVIVDRAVGMPLQSPVVVRDHLNLTGDSPLCGPNDPCGERFPVVQGIYVEDALANLPHVVVAGLKQGVVPTGDDIDMLKGLEAQTCCYNIVPAMLIAAHARCKVLAIVLPENGSLSPELTAEIHKLTGANA